MIKQQFKLMWSIAKQKPETLTKNNLLYYLKHKNGFMKVATVNQKLLRVFNERYLILNLTTIPRMSSRPNVIISKEGAVQAFDSEIYALFPRLLKYNTSRTLSGYLKQVDTLFERQGQHSEPFSQIIEGLQSNSFFLTNGKKTIVKQVAEKMLISPDKSKVKEHHLATLESLSREVKVNVIRLAYGEFVSEDFYNLQLSLPMRVADKDADRDHSRVDSVYTDMHTKLVAFQMKYDMHADMFFLAEARNKHEQLETEALEEDDFNAIDAKLQEQIAKFVQAKFVQPVDELKVQSKIDYAEGIKVKRLINNQNNMVD